MFGVNGDPRIHTDDAIDDEAFILLVLSDVPIGLRPEDAIDFRLQSVVVQCPLEEFHFDAFAALAQRELMFRGDVHQVLEAFWQLVFCSRSAACSSC